MQLITGNTESEAAGLAAGLIEDEIRSNPTASVMPATGTTPVPVYEVLAERHSAGRLDTGRVHVFQLDEYVGVPESDPRSLYSWMKRVFLEPLDIPESRVTRLRGDVPDLDKSCSEYESAVRATGGIDVAILGLGLDGHLGYNEPPSSAEAPTRVVTLRPESRETAASYWPPGHVAPDRGITAGMSVILRAASVILLVFGAHKREILHQVLEGPVGPQVPGSYLRNRDGVTIVTDEAAMGRPQ